MKLGPLDLIAELNAPEVLYSNHGLMIVCTGGRDGNLYEILPNAGATVADLQDGIAHLPQGALLRDAFNDEGEICINFWKAA
ncbi:hypothetical protein SAMN05216275_1055 [Streptosporangium canum]|uniref:Uncharacterized protein n=1 Tax=Streptosporangium canum TaxID=324952 RepID=A0A1I3L467_9ACTN|nr:hypothetical protein [Streptosporangium canum]SFI79376.1 hypothetical protein SAMN05216275_1055 [Streptosporangium canum]